MEFTIQKKEQLNVCDDKTRHTGKIDPSEKLRPVTLSLLRYNHVCIRTHATNTRNKHTHTFALFSFVWQCCALVKNVSMRRNEKLV